MKVWTSFTLQNGRHKDHRLSCMMELKSIPLPSGTPPPGPYWAPPNQGHSVHCPAHPRQQPMCPVTRMWGSSSVQPGRVWVRGETPLPRSSCPHSPQTLRPAAAMHRVRPGGPEQGRRIPSGPLHFRTLPDPSLPRLPEQPAGCRKCPSVLSNLGRHLPPPHREMLRSACEPGLVHPRTARFCPQDTRNAAVPMKEASSLLEGQKQGAS